MGEAAKPVHEGAVYSARYWGPGNAELPYPLPLLTAGRREGTPRAQWRLFIDFMAEEPAVYKITGLAPGAGVSLSDYVTFKPIGGGHRRGAAVPSTEAFKYKLEVAPMERMSGDELKMALHLTQRVREKMVEMGAMRKTQRIMDKVEAPLLERLVGNPKDYPTMAEPIGHRLPFLGSPPQKEHLAQHLYPVLSALSYEECQDRIGELARKAEVGPAERLEALKVFLKAVDSAYKADTQPGMARLKGFLHLRIFEMEHPGEDDPPIKAPGRGF